MSEGRPAATLALRGLDLGDEPAAWAELGLCVDPQGRTWVGAVALSLLGGADHPGLLGWHLEGLGPTWSGDLDGIPTHRATSGGPPANQDLVHRMGARAVDHVVVTSPDVDRTAAAFAAAGAPPRRERRGADGRRQVFVHLGTAIAEVVGPTRPGPGPARLWGLVLVVDDLEATAAELGELVGPVRDAVQPGRRIATVRHRAAGISTALALMSPRPPSTSDDRAKPADR